MKNRISRKEISGFFVSFFNGRKKKTALIYCANAFYRLIGFIVRMAHGLFN
jgi:hypothetical protein